MLPADLEVAVGSGAVASRGDSRASPTVGSTSSCRISQPSAAVLAELAFESGETLPSLRPLYLSPPDAKPQTAAAVAMR